MRGVTLVASCNRILVGWHKLGYSCAVRGIANLNYQSEQAPIRVLSATNRQGKGLNHNNLSYDGMNLQTRG